MFDPQWYTSSLQVALQVLLSTAGFYIALIVMVRLNGLRTFSKMSSFDFAVTVAVGSLFASTLVSEDPSLLQGGAGLLSLLFLQRVVASLRSSFRSFEGTVDNSPVLLMKDGQMLHHNLKKTRVTVSDLRAKLREANAQNYAQVRAVVLEATGDISVLHCSDDTVPFESDLLEGVTE